MAETDDPQNKPENPGQGRPSNRSHGRRPWQNRSSRDQSRAPRPAPETPAGTSAGPDESAWRPLPATTGRSSGDASRSRRSEEKPARPRGEGAGERDSGRSGSPSRSRTNGRPSRPAGETPAGQPSGRSKNRPPRQSGGEPVASQAGRRQNQNRSRRRVNPEGASAGQAQKGGGGPSAGGSERPRRRPDGSQQRQPSRRDGSGRGRSTASRGRSDSSFHPPSVPIKARGGIRARTENGEFGKNWWAKRWLLAMERLMDGARLQRGRRYASMGQVLSMNEENRGIVAKVQGSRPQPYKVTIRVSPLTDEQWDKVLDVLADQAIFTAQLLAGEMPADIEEAFSAAGVSLFPARGGDLMTECSCPDWANPCKHIAATHYILGDRFDEDPFLIFRMRGRDQEAILQGLRQRRAGQEEPLLEEPEPEEIVEPLDSDLAHFWDIGPGLENYSVNVQPPQVDLPLLKRLGQPDFARSLPLERELGPAYEAISQAALLLAFSDISREPPAENGQEGS